MNTESFSYFPCLKKNDICQSGVKVEIQLGLGLQNSLQEKNKVCMHIYLHVGYVSGQACVIMFKTSQPGSHCVT